MTVEITVEDWGAGGIEHLPDRPSWDCRDCGRAWPCEAARTRLAAEMNQIELSIYAAVCLYQSVEDLPALTPAERFDRFLGWCRRTTGG